ALVCVLVAACAKPPAAAIAPDAPVDAAPAAVLPRCESPGAATFKLDPSAVISKNLVGFGAQFNANAYAQISIDAGLTPQDLPAMEAKAPALAPKHVRIFWNPTGTPDQTASFEQTVALAQKAGASVNVTYWHGPYPDPAGQMHAFAAELQRVPGVRYVT